MKAATKPRAVQQLIFDGADDRKPTKSYVEMVVEVLRDSYAGEMHPSEIYQALEMKYSYYRNMSPRSKKSWMSSIRHALLHQAFKSRPGDVSSKKRGKIWSLNENFNEQQRERPGRSPSSQMQTKKRKSVPLQELPMPQADSHLSGGNEVHGVNINQSIGNQHYPNYGFHSQQYGQAADNHMISSYAATNNLPLNSYFQNRNSPSTLPAGSYYSSGHDIPVRSYVMPGPVQNGVRFLPPPGGMTIAPILSPPAVTSSFLSDGLLVSSRRSPVYGPVPVVDPNAAANAFHVVPQNAPSHVMPATEDNKLSSHAHSIKSGVSSTQQAVEQQKTSRQQQDHVTTSDSQVTNAPKEDPAITSQNQVGATVPTEQQQHITNGSQNQQACMTTPKGKGAITGSPTKEHQDVHSSTCAPAIVQIHHYSPKDVQKQDINLPPAPENCACCVMYYTPPKRMRTDAQYDCTQQQPDGPENQMKTERTVDSSAYSEKDDLQKIIRKSLDIGNNESGGWVNEWTSFMTESMMGAMGQSASKLEVMYDQNSVRPEREQS
ncbi:forkhead box protein F1-like [Ptychodera flava]|uniref:forkhead box protein F1-like n=1 Tax=Ptychodera flava TaxID=63121 RepID=UPI00396AA1CC